MDLPLLSCLLALASFPTILGGPAPSPTPSPPSLGSRSREDFPDDVPLYSPAAQSVLRSRPGQATAAIFTDDPPDKVSTFYGDFAKKQGWKADTDVVGKRTDGFVMILRKGQRVLRVDGARDPVSNQTDVFLVVGVPVTPTPRPSPSPSR